ncbi:MAG: hypothetical protein ATN36_04720 [Epulopiscium sp. Nele67-Bin005]|nr:MAG: hypothetical protein ATN36_04720 [Epulopiscium sp. Nele67-Bin005]
MITGNPYMQKPIEQLINGQLRYIPNKVSPTHSTIRVNLWSKFKEIFQTTNYTALPHMDISFERGVNKFAPDISIVDYPSKITSDVYYGIPTLVVEILSPINECTKIDIYTNYGVDEYWEIDPKTETIKQFVLTDEQFNLVNTVSNSENEASISPSFCENESIFLKDIFLYPWSE